MPNNLSYPILITILCLALQGCMPSGGLKPADLPDRLNDTGIVMLQISPTLSWGMSEVYIPGVRKNKTHKGFYLKELKPGNYKLEWIKARAGFSSVPNIDYYKRLNVGLDFTVHKGKVTNLGMIYLRPDRHGKQYNILRFKNGNTPFRYLKEFHPNLAKNLSIEQFETSSGTYDNDKIDLVRRGLIADTENKPERRIGDGTDLTLFPSLLPKGPYWVGNLGIISDTRAINKQGQAVFLNTNTLENIIPLSFTEQHQWFLSETGLLLKRNGENIKHIPVPQNFFPVRGALLSDNGIVLTDRFLNTIVSMDQGQSWKQHKYSIKESEIGPGSFSQSPGGIYALASSFSVLGGTSRAVFVDAKTGKVNKVSLPDVIDDDLRAISKTDIGVFVLGHSYPDTLYFRPNGSTKWQQNEILNHHHCQIDFPGNTGYEAIAKCTGPEGKVKMMSTDQGNSWQPL